MRRGSSPTAAAEVAITRIVNRYPEFMGAVIAVNLNGEYGAACNGITEFPFSVASGDGVVVERVKCNKVKS